MEGRPERKNVNETGSLNEHRQFYWAKSYAPGGTSDAFHRILSDRDSRQGLIIRTPVSLLFTVRAASYETLFLYHMPFSLELSFQPTLISMHYPMLMVHSIDLIHKNAMPTATSVIISAIVASTAGIGIEIRSNAIKSV